MCDAQCASHIDRERCSRGLGDSRECWIKDVKSGRFIFDVGSKRETITNQRAQYWLCSLYTPECLFMIQIWDLREYLWIWMHECVCVLLGATHPFPLYGGPLRGGSIVVVPCPFSRDIHHRGAPECPPPFHIPIPGEGFNEDQIAPSVWALWWSTPVQFWDGTSHTWTLKYTCNTQTQCHSQNQFWQL